eukprot:COSAG06_NODE_5194_length_3646_cov_7.440372_6_plen_23_part_01
MGGVVGTSSSDDESMPTPSAGGQ